MSFTTDWFSQHIPNWTVLLAPYKGKPKLQFLEIGSFEGMSAQWLLENILTDTTSHITCIDTFNGDIDIQGGAKFDMKPVYGRFKENVLDKYGDQVTVIQEYSQKALLALQDQYDFIYVDGSHTAEDTLKDMMFSWDVLKNGGIMVIDDAKWYTYIEPTRNPFLGIDAFKSVYRDRYQLLHDEYQVFLRKI